MKFGNMEGNPEEIKDFIDISGLNVLDYVELPKSQISPVWLIVASFLFVSSAAGLIFFTPNSEATRISIFLIGIIGGIGFAVLLQIRFLNIIATSIVLVVVPLILLVAMGTLSPLEMTEKIEKITNQ